MNDFSKTDLREIYRCLKYITKGDVTPYSCHTLSLCKKVHAMIDNYCEPNANKPNFTQDQKDFICYQIGDWYLMMKPLLEVQHNLGFMKEKLKTMICGED